MNLSEYIKLIFEGRPASQNVKAAMEMSDDELVDYLEELFGVDETFTSQPSLYQYVRKNRKDVLEKLKAKKEKGIDYYRNIISKFKTLSELKSQYPNLVGNLYKKFSVEVTNDLLSGLERSPRREFSQNVKAAMEMSDNELVNYLDELFSDSGTPLTSQTGLYQYLRKNRKEVLEKLKTKREKGIDYYKNLISQFKTLPELKSEYPNLREILNKKLGKEVTNDLLSGLERGKRGRPSSKPTTQDTDPETIQQTVNPYLRLQDLGSILSNYSSFDEFRMKNVKLLSDLTIELGNEQVSDFMNDVENRFLKLQPLSLEKTKKIISNYEYLGDFRKENPILFIDMKKTFDKDVVIDLLSGLKRGVAERKKEKFSVTNAREIISKYTDLDIFTTQRSDVVQNIRKYFGSHGFYELTKSLNRKKQVSEPKEKLPTGKIREIATKYKGWDSLLANEKDFVKLGLKIYGTQGFKNLVNKVYGITDPIKTTKSILTKGSISKIPNSKIEDFLSNFPTKESLKSERPEVYDTFEELGIINSYYGR